MLAQILVKNVPLDITLRQLELRFSAFGKVKIITTSFHPGIGRTNAVVTYFNSEAARHANGIISGVLQGADQTKHERMHTGTQHSNQPTGGEQGPRGASKRARQSVFVTPPASPPTSPEFEYFGNQVVTRQDVPPSSGLTDSIMGLCSLSSEQICAKIDELPAADPVSNSVTMMTNTYTGSCPLDGAMHKVLAGVTKSPVSREKRKRKAPKGPPPVRVSKLGKIAPRSRRGGGARQDKEPSKKAAAVAWRARFQSDESTAVQEADEMCHSLELAIATARALELNMKGYELDRRNPLSESLEASRTEMLTWQQADVIIQALEAGIIALARRPLIDTKVERLPRHVRSLNPSSGARRQLTMRNSCEAVPRVGMNV
jgi:hypothetical protein